MCQFFSWLTPSEHDKKIRHKKHNRKLQTYSGRIFIALSFQPNIPWMLCIYSIWTMFWHKLIIYPLTRNEGKAETCITFTYAAYTTYITCSNSSNPAQTKKTKVSTEHKTIRNCCSPQGLTNTLPASFPQLLRFATESTTGRSMQRPGGGQLISSTGHY